MTLEELRSYKLEELYEAGFFEPGWKLEDYIRYAVKKYKWECIPIWGIKGSYKSNRGLYYLYTAYQDWDTVLEYTIMTPEEFVKVLNMPGRIPACFWDDIGAWFDSLLYFENRGLYMQIRRNWKLMRTKLNVFLCSIPRKDELPPFILDDMTSEVFCSPRMRLCYDRWAWEKNPKKPTKIQKRALSIHSWRPFDITEVPEEVFRKYFKRRIELADTGRKKLIEALERAFDDAPVQKDEIDEQKEIDSFSEEELETIRRWQSYIGRKGRNVPPK